MGHGDAELYPFSGLRSTWAPRRRRHRSSMIKVSTIKIKIDRSFYNVVLGQ